MKTDKIESRFAEMGARMKLRDIAPRWNGYGWVQSPDYAVDIQRDRNGEFFELRIPENLRDSIEVTVMQSEPKERHLLLSVRKTGDKPQLDRFLCGRLPIHFIRLIAQKQSARLITGRPWSVTTWDDHLWPSARTPSS